MITSCSKSGGVGIGVRVGCSGEAGSIRDVGETEVSKLANQTL